VEPNFRVGQYVFEKPLGEGGMAEVWLARNVHIGNLAAIKFLNNDYAGKPEIEQRFVNEGRRQGALSHPNIIKIYGFEYVEGRSFLILQYVDGETLGDLVERAGPLEVSEALRIGISVLNALDYAHENNLVHRDIKPSNILLDKHGFPYLGDFGIVRALNAQSGTTTGMVMGTSLYMSPEQFKSPKAVDRRSDIYSFGCMLYQMLAGDPPFNPPDTGDEGWFVAVMLAHLQEPPPPLRLRNPSVSPAIEAVVMRCLAKNPDERYTRCRDVRDALSAAMVARPSAPRPQTVVEIPAPAVVTRPVAGATRVIDGLTHVWIPPGTFMMGCSPGDKECSADETPAHQVTISRGFWMGQTTVTQEAFERVIGRNPSRFKGPQRPAENVTWHEAQEYCRAVGLRLPTEAQWEYAGRGGNPSKRYGKLAEVAWYKGNVGLFGKTHNVGQSLPSAHGLYDMLGNIWEWTADWFDLRYYASSPATDPTGPSEGTHRAVRGGCWGDAPSRIRVSARNWRQPNRPNDFIGFRCVGD
jgi:formylglycine-generating enzyme required for sulfatase activity